MKKLQILKWHYSNCMTATPRIAIENPATLNKVYIDRCEELSPQEQIDSFLVFKGFTIVGHCH